jgi:hypothetical protein
MQSKPTTEQLSRELAKIAGLRLRPSRAGEKHHTPAGQLRSKLPDDFFNWFKCPTHNTWLQPELRPFYHWKCQAKSGCIFSRSAKLRTRIERRIFAVQKFLEELDAG